MQTKEEKDRIITLVQSLTLFDDTFFHKFAEDKKAIEEILRVILEDQNLIVESVKPQDSLKNLSGRSVVLDAMAILRDGRKCNIEIQKANNDDHQRRVRYNSSCITTNYTKRGDNFSEIPDLIIIYISKFDIFKSGLPCYHIQRIVEETGKIVYNGFEEIYVNCTAKTDDKISRLMDCFVRTTVDSKEFPELTRRCKEIKSKGEIGMCDKVEEYAKEYAKKYAEEYATIQKIEMILSLNESGVDKNIIARSTGKNINTINSILEMHKNGIEIDQIFQNILSSTL